VEHTHEYDCIVCGLHLDSQKELDKHNNECHISQQAGSVRNAEPIGNERSRSKPESGEPLS
jgi:hypothetical protein